MLKYHYFHNFHIVERQDMPCPYETQIENALHPLCSVHFLPIFGDGVDFFAII